MRSASPSPGLFETSRGLRPWGGLLPGNGPQCMIKTLISNPSPARLTWLLPPAAGRVGHKMNIYCEMRRFPHMGKGPNSSSANLTPSDAHGMTICSPQSCVEFTQFNSNTLLENSPLLISTALCPHSRLIFPVILANDLRSN